MFVCFIAKMLYNLNNNWFLFSKNNEDFRVAAIYHVYMLETGTLSINNILFLKLLLSI